MKSLHRLLTLIFLYQAYLVLTVVQSLGFQRVHGICLRTFYSYLLVRLSFPHMCTLCSSGLIHILMNSSSLNMIGTLISPFLHFQVDLNYRYCRRTLLDLSRLSLFPRYCYSRILLGTALCLSIRIFQFTSRLSTPSSFLDSQVNSAKEWNC